MSKASTIKIVNPPPGWKSTLTKEEVEKVMVKVEKRRKKEKKNDAMFGFKKILETKKDELGKYRDGLRDLMDEYEQLLENVERAHEALDEAVEIISQLV